MKNKSIHIAAVAAAVFVPLALFLHTFSASPLPKPEPYTGPQPSATPPQNRSEEHTSELQSRLHLVCRLLLEKNHDAVGRRDRAGRGGESGRARAPARRPVRGVSAVGG